MSAANKNPDVKVKSAEIDLDVLEILGKECALSAVSSERDMRRFELNCLAESLSQKKLLLTHLDELLNILMVCGNEKIVDFFTSMRKNVEAEKKALEEEAEQEE